MPTPTAAPVDRPEEVVVSVVESSSFAGALVDVDDDVDDDVDVDADELSVGFKVVCVVLGSGADMEMLNRFVVESVMPLPDAQRTSTYMLETTKSVFPFDTFHRCLVRSFPSPIMLWSEYIRLICTLRSQGKATYG